MLTSRDVEAIAEATARKVVEIAREPTKTFGLVDARELAGELGVSLDYVYAHAAELGAMRLGLGPKARIRFDLHRARQALEARSVRPAKRRAR
jgi:pantoate kinase